MQTAWHHDWRSRAKLALEAHPDLAGWGLVLLPLALLMAWAQVAQGKFDRLPITTIYLVSTPGMFALPAFLVMRHRWRQERTMSRIRGLYAMACELLDEERIDEARRVLASIRRWERQWRLGDSTAYRLAYAILVIAATVAVVGVHYFFYTNIYSQYGYMQTPQKTLAETAHYLLDNLLQIWIIGGLGVLFGLRAREHLHDLKGAPWAEFYGDRLAAAIKAGRGVKEAPQHTGRQLPVNGTARELLGLPAHFTSAELRRAWLRLVRELHPDRWAAAGEGVRRMKEAALKRVNAARDELAGQALG